VATGRRYSIARQRQRGKPRASFRYRQIIDLAAIEGAAEIKAADRQTRGRKDED
jgi:hypothetical protein